MNGPELDDVREHAARLGLNAGTAERFHAWYAARGWLINGKPILNWKKVLMCWGRKEGKPSCQYFGPYPEDVETEPNAPKHGRWGAGRHSRRL